MLPLLRYENLSRSEQAVLAGIPGDIDGFCSAYDSLVNKGLLTEDGDETLLADELIKSAVTAGVLIQSRYGGNRRRPTMDRI